MEPITESELRSCLRASLSKRVRPGKSRLFEELSIEMGAARVDLAMVGEELEAFEIKSDLDDFSRLHNQIHAYNRVFDRITIVTGTVFAAAVLEIVPQWWGVIAAERMGDGELKLCAVRDATENATQQSHSLAMFLWRDEAIVALKEEADVTLPSKATRHQLHASIAASLDLARVKERVLQRLLAREGSRETKPSRPSGDSSHLDASCWDFHSLT